MRLNLLFFGVLKDRLGTDRESLDAFEGATVDMVVGLLAARTSKDQEVWRTLAVAVNREYAAGGTVLKNGDEVALLPPVSGGLEETI